MTAPSHIERELLNLARHLCSLTPSSSGAPETELVSFLSRHGIRNRLRWAEPKEAEGAREYALSTASFALASASRLSKISQRLADHEIPSLTFKGLAWSQLLYGNIASRPFGDVDLLVPPTLLQPTNAALLDLGLERAYPSGLSFGQDFAHQRFGKAQNFINPANNACLDLHWRLFSQWIGLEIPFSDLWQRRTVLEVPGLPPISTFGVEDRIIFTALHGTQDGWSYLKGLLDLAIFLERHPPRWETVTQIAGQRLPLVRQAITFAVHLLGAPNPPDCELFYPDAETTLSAFTALSGKPEPPQLALLRPNLWSGPKLQLGASVVGAILTPAIDDLRSVNLPPRLANLYIAVRLFRLLHKLATRRALK